MVYRHASKVIHVPVGYTDCGKTVAGIELAHCTKDINAML